MPKVAYSEEERQQIRDDLIRTALELMAEQGIQHTTVEQIYKKVGISRTFFYSFFPTKEDLVIEALYYQQPKIIAYVNQLMSDPALKWHDAMSRFIYSCCKGAKSGECYFSGCQKKAIECFGKSRQFFLEKYWNVSELNPAKSAWICLSICV